MALMPFKSDIAIWCLELCDVTWRAFMKIDSGDLPTWVSAVGTFLTFVLLIFQNTQLRKEQKQQKKDLDKERERREEHENKQRDLWRIQEEITSIQKYDSHKRLFINELKGLEQRFDYLIDFPDKEASYNQLFPENSLIKCELLIDLNSLEQSNNSGSLSDCLGYYSRIGEILIKMRKEKTEHSDQLCYELCTNYMMLLGRLGLKIHTKNKVGYIYPTEQDQPTINIFKTTESLFYIEACIDRICSFAHVKTPNIYIYSAEFETVRNALLEFTLKDKTNSCFTVYLGSIKNELYCIYLCYKFFNNTDYKKSEPFFSNYNKLCNFLLGSGSSIELLFSKEKCHELLDELSDSLSKVNNNTHAQHLIKEINKTINLDFSDAV